MLHKPLREVSQMRAHKIAAVAGMVAFVVTCGCLLQAPSITGATSLEDAGHSGGKALEDRLGLRRLLDVEELHLGLENELDSNQAVHEQQQHQRKLKILVSPSNVNIVRQVIPTSAKQRPTSTAHSTVYTNSPGAQIPQSFLGISHEWEMIEEMAGTEEYIKLLLDMAAYGTGPLILRVGGSSTDFLKTVSPQSVWDTFKTLIQQAGMQFIIGLPFKTQDVPLARRQMAMAKAQMPRASILAFEIGNEPNFYESVKGMSTKQWLDCCFVNDFGTFAYNLSCPSWRTCEYQQIAGPAWGHVAMYPKTLDWLLKRSHPFLNMVTLHWYKSTAETFNTAQSLLHEAPLRKDMNRLKILVATSKRYNKPLRVAEMNTISNSGRSGVSNAFAAALWSLDSTFEVAAAGAVGVNFHWGQGQNLYNAVIRWKEADGTILPPIVRPPFYAYLMFQMAVGRGSRFLHMQLNASPGSALKLWPLQDVSTGAIRVVIINKHATSHGRVTLQLDGAGYNHARLLRMRAPSLESLGGVTLGNMSYRFPAGGPPKGVPTAELLYRQAVPNNQARLQYTVYVPAASAALVIIPKA